MFARMISKLTLALALSMSFGAVACSKEEPKTANLKPGEMPAGAEWQGVYYSQVYGNLHMVAEGDKVTGKWRTDAGDAWGELNGESNGDVLKYEWAEHKIGMIGPSATTNGKGYFRYSRPENGDPDEIKGEWGLNDEMTGNPWEAVKQKNVVPNPDSVMPDEVEGRFSGGSGEWDSDESGKPKPSADEDAEDEELPAEDEPAEDSGKKKSSGWD